MVVYFVKEGVNEKLILLKLVQTLAFLVIA